MFKRIRAWFARRHIEHDAAEYERGLRWAHHEIVFGHGYDYVEAMTYGAWGAFDRGAYESLREHALQQTMLGREVNERTRALAEEQVTEFERMLGRTRRHGQASKDVAVFRFPEKDEA